MKLLFYDVETTGLYWQMHGIRQVSAKMVIDGKAEGVFSATVKPIAGKAIDDKALAVSGVTREMLETFEPADVVFAKFERFLRKHIDNYNPLDKCYLVGFRNRSFDDDFLRQWFKDNQNSYFGSYFLSDSWDVSVMASMALANERKHLPNMKLATIAGYLGAEVDATKLHDSMYDVELTQHIYDTLKLMY